MLGQAKLEFPRFESKNGLDLFFAKVERYFALCDTHPSIWVQYTVMSLDAYAEWWDTHLLTAPEHCAHDWEYFKATIRRFAVSGDPRTYALSKLLDIRQGSWSLPSYCQNFMRLVNDSKTCPDQPWLIPRFLKGLNDNTLRRAATSNNGARWNSITDLLQHVTTLTAFDNSNMHDANSRERPAAGKQHKSGQFKKDFGKRDNKRPYGNPKRDAPAAATAFQAGAGKTGKKPNKKRPEHDIVDVLLKRVAALEGRSKK